MVSLLLFYISQLIIIGGNSVKSEAVIKKQPQCRVLESEYSDHPDRKIIIAVKAFQLKTIERIDQMLRVNSCLKNLKLTDGQVNPVLKYLLSRKLDLESLEIEKSHFPTLTKVFDATPVNLTILKFYECSIKRIDLDAFENLGSVLILDLSSNLIQELDSLQFRPLIRLTRLRLTRNKLSSLPEDVFKHLANLEQLFMDGNQIESIPPKLFSGLKNLQFLNMNSNMLKKLHGDTFNSNVHLEVLLIEKNSLTEINSTTFKATKLLATLSFARNRLTNLSENLLSGLHSLSVFDVNYNMLTSIPPLFFKDQACISKADFCFNNLKELPHRLSGESILNNEEIRDPVLPQHSAKKILTLNLHHNDISIIHPQTFQGLEINEIDLRYNDLNDTVDIVLESFAEIKNLVHLNLEHNFIRSKPQAINTIFDFFKSLKILDLRENKIESLCVLCFPCALEQLKLRSNSILKIDLNRNDFSNKKENCLKMRNCSNVLTVNLEDNPITHLFDDDTINIYCADLDRNSTCEIPKKSTKSQLEFTTSVFPCGCPEHIDMACLENKGISWKNSIAKCPYADQSCIRLRSCGPANCVCDNDIKYGTLNAVCTGLPLSAIRVTSEYNFSKLNLRIEGPVERNSNLTEEVEQIVDLDVKTAIDLSGLSLTQLPRIFFPDNMTALFLKGNSLETITADEVYTIENIAEHNEDFELFISGNPWSCHCDNKNIKFFEMLVRLQFKVVDIKSAGCTYQIEDWDDWATTIAVLIKPFDRAPHDGPTETMDDLLTVADACVTQRTWRKAISLSLVSLFAIFAIVAAVVLRRKTDPKFIFDAFVTFSYQESDFVYRLLIPMLETQSDPVLKLCVHSRDWVAGVPIMDNLLDSVVNSKKLFAIVSRQYLSSFWCVKEFVTMYTLNPANIVVIFQEIPEEDEITKALPELKQHMKDFPYFMADDRKLMSKLINSVEKLKKSK